MRKSDAAFTKASELEFHEYIGTRKPILDCAFRKALCDLLAPLDLRQAALLMDCLDAGKKIRGCLLCLFCEVLGGEFDAAVPRAVALELVQAASLIHDDFVDGDTRRRGKPAVWTLVGARKAVLIGDVLFASAIRMMTDISLEDGRAISGAIAKLAQGAAMEPIDVCLLPSSDGDYEKIIRFKTGVLFAVACRLGALSAGLHNSLSNPFDRYGMWIGEAYQITDDLHELKRLIDSKWIYSEQVMSLAPCLFHYGDSDLQDISPVVSGSKVQMTDRLSRGLRAVAAKMVNDIECRLKTATEEISDILPPESFDLIRRAPNDLIRMFNAQS